MHDFQTSAISAEYSLRYLPVVNGKKGVVFYCIRGRQSGFVRRSDTVCMDGLEIWEGAKYLAHAACVCGCIAAGNWFLFQCHIVSGVWHGIVPVPVHGSGGWKADSSDRRISGNKGRLLCSGTGLFHRCSLELMENEETWPGGRAFLLSAKLCGKHMGERRDPSL